MHELLHGVHKAHFEPLLRECVQDIVEKLGYEIEVRAHHSVLRSSQGRAQAVVWAQKHTRSWSEEVRVALPRLARRGVF